MTSAFVLEQFWKHGSRNLNEPLMLRGGKYFSGVNVVKHAHHVKELIDITGARDILHYGCGCGYQYLRSRKVEIHKSWKLINPPYRYEPYMLKYSHRPTRKFNGLIVVDVFEHLRESDVQTVLADAMSFLDSAQECFAFFVIQVTLARESSENKNAHLTMKMPGWWAERISQFRRPGLRMRTVYT